MPSSGIVAIDADNDAAVVDASAISVVAEEYLTVQETVKDLGQEDEEQPALSPMPHKKAPMVTPRTDRKVTSPTSATCDSSNSANTPPSSHTPVSSKGDPKKKVAVATPMDAKESISPKESKKRKVNTVPMKTMKHFFGKAGTAKAKKVSSHNASSTKTQKKEENDTQPEKGAEISLAEPADSACEEVTKAKAENSDGTQAKAKSNQPQKNSSPAKKKVKAAPKSLSIEDISVEMDYSPMDALAIVSRYMSAGRRSRTSSSASASRKKDGNRTSVENKSLQESSNHVTLVPKPNINEIASAVEEATSKEFATNVEEATSSSTADNDGENPVEVDCNLPAAKEKVDEESPRDDDATVALEDSGKFVSAKSSDVRPVEGDSSFSDLPESEAVECTEESTGEDENKKGSCIAKEDKTSKSIGIVVIDDPTPETESPKQNESTNTAEATPANKKRDPYAPKKPRSALILYHIAKRSEFKAANPDVNAGDITKLMSAEYKKLDAKVKATWEEQAKEDKLRYNKEMSTYKPPEQLCSTENIDDTTAANKLASNKEKPSILQALAACPPSKSKGDKSTKQTIVSANTATSNPTTKAKPVLTEEEIFRLTNFTTLREKYYLRAVQLTSRPVSDDFIEERLSVETADLSSIEKGSVEVDGIFPDQLLPYLMVIVQGSPLPLSTLAGEAHQELSAFVNESQHLTLDLVASKIKLVAQRKSFLNAPSQLDCFENNEESYMWRWELSSTDLLPPKDAAKVKKARAARKKLQNHHKAIINLISAIDKAISSIEANSSSSEKVVAKVSDMEEKVLKFEREEETARLLNKAKAKKQAEDSSKKEEEKANKEAEKERKKIEAAKEREAEKQRKADEKEKEKIAKQQDLEAKENKRKARMMSFFSLGSAKKKQKLLSTPPKETSIVRKGNNASFDSDSFRRSINSGTKHTFSAFTKASRKRKTRNVRVSVFVTAISDNPFSQQPYDEEKIITVPNVYKFLGFHEDVRPPYYGTWSKTSSIVTGRNPFGKDAAILDYEVDSEAEWEEGDDDQGEDLNEEVGEEEEDEVQDEDSDDWLAAEDDLGIDDEDEETRELRKRKLRLEANLQRSGHYKACVIAPQPGGIPHDGNCEVSLAEGFSLTDALVVLSTHVGCVLSFDVDAICLDAFSPTDSAKNTDQSKDCSNGQNDEMTSEAKKIVAQFVHNSTVNSKDKLVTELLKAHPSVTKSRAQAMREVDFMAEKKKVPKEAGGGVVWEVKPDLLNTLGLSEQDLKQPPKVTTLPSNVNDDSPPPKSQNPGTEPAETDNAGVKKTKKKDPNAPKKPRSSFMYFSNAKRAEVKAANPDASFGDIGKLLGEEWKKLGNDDKAEYEEQAEVDKKRYQKEMGEYSVDSDGAGEKKLQEIMKDQSLNEQRGSRSTPSPNNLSPGACNSTKKRKAPAVSVASVNLFAAFLKKKKTE